MSPNLEAYLRRSPLTDAQRADLWDAFEEAEDQDALAQRLQGLNIPNDVKADLWDMKAGSESPKPPGARPIPPGTKPPGMLEKAGDFALGAAKGYGQTMARTMGPLAMGPLGVLAAGTEKGYVRTPEALQPTEAQKPGYYAETVAESFVPGGPVRVGAGMARRLAGAALSPAGGAVVGGGVSAASGGNALDIAEGATAGAALGGVARALKMAPGASRSLGARLSHLLGRAAKAEPEVARAAESVVMPASRTVGNTAPRIAEAQIAEAARRAASAPRAATSAAPVTMPATRSVPAGGEDAAMAAINNAARSVSTGPKPVSKVGAPSARAKAKQPPKGAPKAAAKPTATTPEEADADDTLTSQLKASVLPKAKLALEVERKVLVLKGSHGLSNDQVTNSLRELYGIPLSYGKKMVEMILKTHGIQ